jgi:hypothetical protein
MTQLAAASRARSRLAASLFVAGLVAVALALVATSLGVAASTAFGWKKATLLIAGCDMIVASLVVSARHRWPEDGGDFDVAALLSGAIADGVMTFAISAAAIIVLFDQSKSIERLGYFLALLVIVPLSVTLAWRRHRAGVSPERQQLVAFAMLIATATVLCLARLLMLSPSATLDTTLFVLIALVAGRAGIALSARLLPAAWPERIPTRALIAATPLMLAAAATPFVPSGTLSVLDIAVGLAAGLATFDVVRAFGGRWRLPRAWVRVLDVGVVVVCVLVVVYLGAPTFAHGGISLSLALAGNHNYFLGPAIDVLHGHPMLISTFSQYGVGLMDALAAIFLVVPIGYGTFTLLLSAGTALLFVVVYVVLRWSTESLLIAAAGVALAIVLGTFGTLGYYAWAPSTGVLRFGLPWLVILFSLGSARTPAHKRLFDALVFATVAVAAIWSGEAGVYCLGTAVALACLDAAVADAEGRERVRMAARRIVQLVAVSASALLIFTLLTRVLAGAWPDWGAYIYFVRLYTTGGFGNLPILPWSPGLALGAMYTVSAIVIVLLVLSRQAFVRERVVAFRAATGITMLGVLVYTYFLGRAHPNNLYHISPPGVALVFVWLGILRSTFDSRLVMAIASATAISFGAMIVANESGTLGEKYPTTALAAVLGSSRSLTSEVRALWRNPVVDPSSAQVARFVTSLGRPRSNLTLLLTPNVATEALLRLGTANAVGSSQPCQESFSSQGPGRAAKEVHALRPGGIVVTSNPPNNAGLLLPIQQYTLTLLRDRFTFQEIAADGQGLLAYRMTRLAPVATRPPPAPAPPLIATGCA